MNSILQMCGASLTWNPYGSKWNPYGSADATKVYNAEATKAGIVLVAKHWLVLIALHSAFA